MEAAELWQRSEEYMVMVVPKIVPRESWEVLATAKARVLGTEYLDASTLGEIVLMEIRTAFLFPHLGEGDRLMLVGAWLANRNSEFAEHMKGWLSKAKDVLTDVSQLKAEATEAVEGMQLSDLQRQVALNYYLNADSDG